MKKQKIDNDKIRDLAWIVIVVVLLVGGFYWFTDFTDEEEEYVKNCVDSCVSYMGDCAGISYVLNSDGESWLYGWDFEDCLSELESCIDECEKE